MNDCVVEGEYIVIKAEESNVSVIGLTRGGETKSQHTEKLDKGEVLIMQFTENVAGMKIKGHATITTKHGVVVAEGVVK